jgi:hypothetical protein
MGAEASEPFVFFPIFQMLASNSSTRVVVRSERRQLLVINLILFSFLASRTDVSKFVSQIVSQIFEDRFNKLEGEASLCMSRRVSEERVRSASASLRRVVNPIS